MGRSACKQKGRIKARMRGKYHRPLDKLVRCHHWNKRAQVFFSLSLHGGKLTVAAVNLYSSSSSSAGNRTCFPDTINVSFTCVIDCKRQVSIPEVITVIRGLNPLIGQVSFAHFQNREET